MKRIIKSTLAAIVILATFGTASIPSSALIGAAVSVATAVSAAITFIALRKKRTN